MLDAACESCHKKYWYPGLNPGGDRGAGEVMRRAAAITSVCLVIMVMATLSAQTRTGSIQGHVKVTGDLPGNSIIRMGMDPKCAEMHRGERGSCNRASLRRQTAAWPMSSYDSRASFRRQPYRPSR